MSDLASSSSIVVCLSLQVLAFRFIVAANWILGQSDLQNGRHWSDDNVHFLSSGSGTVESTRDVF